MGSPYVIAELEKNRSERVRVALDHWRGHDLIDLRIMTPLNDVSGQWIATKKGISLRVGQLPGLLNALQDAVSAAEARGLLGEGGGE